MKKSELIKDLKGLSKDDLKSKAKTYAEEIMKLRFRKASGQLEQSHHLSEAKKNLARVKTLLNKAS